MKVKFNCDQNKCSACGACAIACMDQNDIDVEAGELPLRTVVAYEEKGRRVYNSLACMHCADAPCVKGCPAHCLYKDESTGLTLYDPDKCAGCRRCAMMCPYGAPGYITFDKNGKIRKCDGCVQRILDGREPACVRACPVGALTCAISED